MSKPEFVYAIYIASTPEKIFKALTDGKMTEQYWDGNRVVSDWKVGSPFALQLKRDDKDVVGKVLEFDPPRRLAYTFHPRHGGLEAEQPSRVTFELERQQGPGQAHRRSRQLRARQQGVRKHQPRLAVRAVEPQELSRDRQGAARAMVRHRERLARRGDHPFEKRRPESYHAQA